MWVSPSYHKWAPWIGSRTRANNIVFNTEYMKGQGRKRANLTEQAEMDIRGQIDKGNYELEGDINLTRCFPQTVIVLRGPCVIAYGNCQCFHRLMQCEVW